MKKIVAIAGTIIVAAALIFIFVNNDDKDESVNEEVDIKQLVHDYSVGNKIGESASITGTELIVTDKNEKETVYQLPEEEFFVSIAPYMNHTHP